MIYAYFNHITHKVCVGSNVSCSETKFLTKATLNVLRARLFHLHLLPNNQLFLTYTMHLLLSMIPFFKAIVIID